MKNIIIVQCMSTGKNYVQDIIDRNLNPIVLEMKLFDDSEDAIITKEEINAEYELIDNDFDVIYEKDTYEETLEMVKKYDPLLIVPGAEDGVVLATKLANDLNLLCNPIENLGAFTLKNEMHNRLAENNLRSIKGQVVRSLEEAVEYYDKENLKEVVVKPIYSAASVGVRLCSDRQEMIDAVKEVFTLTGIYENKMTELIIQERINGQEYVVDTVSCNGVHRVTLVWKYNKIKTPEGGNIYDYDETVNELGIGEAELVEYAFDVADALGIKYGPIHGEYIIDEKGPVLIEVNCRPHGHGLDAEFLDRISGQHETDSSLDSYLNPEKFNLERLKGYNLYAHGIVKNFIVPKDLIVKSSPINFLADNLKSFFKTNISIKTPKIFHKTQDLETVGGTIFLVHNDPQQIQKDVEFLRDIEKRAFQLVLSEEMHKNVTVDKNEIKKSIPSLINDIKPYGTCLLVTENIYNNLSASQVLLKDLNTVKGKFDCVVINLNRSIADEKDYEIVRMFLNIFDKVKSSGGLVFIPKTTYDYMPNSRLGAEALVKVSNFKIEMPIHKLNRMLIASKR